MDVVDFAQHLYKVLKEREEYYKEALAGGSAQDYAQYRGTVGKIQGIAETRDEIKALLEKQEDDVDEILDSG